MNDFCGRDHYDAFQYDTALFSNPSELYSDYFLQPEEDGCSNEPNRREVCRKIPSDRVAQPNFIKENRLLELQKRKLESKDIYKPSRKEFFAGGNRSGGMEMEFSINSNMLMFLLFLHIVFYAILLCLFSYTYATLNTNLQHLNDVVKK